MSSAPRAARVARRAYLLLARRREAAIRVSLAFASSAPVGADAVSSELFAPGLGPLVLLIEPAPMARLCSRVKRAASAVAVETTPLPLKRPWQIGSELADPPAAS